MLSVFCRGCFPTVAIGCVGVVLSMAVGLAKLAHDVRCALRMAAGVCWAFQFALA